MKTIKRWIVFGAVLGYGLLLFWVSGQPFVRGAGAAIWTVATTSIAFVLTCLWDDEL